MSVEEVLEHLQQREMRIVCPAELAAALNTGKDNVLTSNDFITLGRLRQRLMKYKKYGFTLCLDSESLKCTFIADMIRELMETHVMERNSPQKHLISIGQGFGDTGIDPSDEESVSELAVMSKNAMAAQSLFNDYITSVVSNTAGMCNETSRIVAEYAARADETVYHEDPVWAKRVLKAQERLAELLAEKW